MCRGMEFSKDRHSVSIKKFSSAFPEICVLASGGVRGVDDIKRLNEMGIFAVIFGKAYYEGILNLKDLEQFLVKKQV